MKSETQRDRVLEYLLDGGILTDYNGIKIKRKLMLERYGIRVREV